MVRNFPVDGGFFNREAIPEVASNPAMDVTR
jgi:hypothetical protein